MAQDWQLDGPAVLEIGDDEEPVTALRVGIVGGRVDVVTHEDSPGARVEVADVAGLPVQVTWDGSTLRLTHGKDSDKNLLDMLKRTLENVGRNTVTVSFSVPVGARVSVSTVSADALLSGIGGGVKVNTLSGTLTLSDLAGPTDLNTVSGNVECTDLRGPLTVNAVSGGVTARSSTLPRVRINTVSGDVTLDLTNPTAEIRSNSVSGDVTVRAPRGGFDVSANTASGQVVVDGRRLAPHQYDQHGPQHGRGGRLTEGDGALRIKANSVSGSVVVLRPGPRDATDEVPQDAPQDAPPGRHPADDGGADPAAGPR